MVRKSKSPMSNNDKKEVIVKQQPFCFQYITVFFLLLRKREEKTDIENKIYPSLI